MSFEEREEFPLLLADMPLKQIAQVENQFRQPGAGFELRHGAAQVFMFSRQLVEHIATAHRLIPHQWKQHFFFSFEMGREIIAVELQKLLSARAQPFGPHGLDLPKRLLAAAQGQRQTMVMVVR